MKASVSREVIIIVMRMNVKVCYVNVDCALTFALQYSFSQFIVIYL